MFPSRSWFILPLLPLLALPGQPPPQDPATLKSDPLKAEATEVVVDLIVRDRKGKLIRDLKPDEVEILEDGRRQTLTSLRLIRGAEALESLTQKRTPLDPLRQIRLVSLVFESMESEAMRISREAALEFIRRDSDPNVYFAVFRINPTLRALQFFTRDRDSLTRAIQEATSAVQESGPGQRGQFDRGSLAVPTPTLSDSTGVPLNVSAAARSDAQKLSRFFQQMEMLIEEATSSQQGHTTFTALLSLVKGQQLLAGRKTALLFCGGILLNQQTMRHFETLLGEANRTNFTIYGLDGNGLMTAAQSIGGSMELQNAMKRTQERIREEQDPDPLVRGTLQVQDFKKDDRLIDATYKNVQLNLINLSAATGGFAITDTNDFRQPLGRIAEDVWTYYEATYRPANQNLNGEYRKLETRVARRDASVQGRIGFFALPREYRDVMFPWEVPLLKAISASPAPTDLLFCAGSFQFDASTGLVRGVLDLELKHAALTTTPTPDNASLLAHLSLVAIIRNSSGEVARKFQKDVPFTFPSARLDSFKQGVFNFAESFQLAPGRYTVEAALRDRIDNRTGVTRFPLNLDAPSPAPYLSSLALIRRMDPAPAGADTTDPFRIGSQRVTPDLQAEIAAGPGASIPVYCVLYARPDAPRPELHVELKRPGEPPTLLTAPFPEMGADGRIPYAFTVPAAKLAPGEWELTASAVQGAALSNTRTLRVTILPAAN